MILLWGLEDDSPLQLVREALIEKGIEHLFLNHSDILETHLEIEYSEKPRGTLDAYGLRYRLEDFRAMYLRPYDFRQFPHFKDFDEKSDEWRHAITFEDILWGYAELTHATVLNRPSSMLSNSSKPYQCMLIEKNGFKVPETLLTTDPKEVLKFKEENGEVIYKSISGSRSIVNTLDNCHLDRMEDLRWCPTQFQRFIRGEDYRVHVVGKRVFASRVVSEATDYRYGVAIYEFAELPNVLENSCVSLSESLGLKLAGIDLIRTSEGEWFCFEVNPSPAYSVYENSTGQPISLAIAEFLSSTCEKG